VSGTPEVAGRRRTGVARNTIIFSIATGLSRIMGLVREIVAARYFGTSGQASAFTIAFQVPNLVRALSDDAATTLCCVVAPPCSFGQPPVTQPQVLAAR